MKRERSAKFDTTFDLRWIAWHRSNRLALFNVRRGQRHRFVGLMEGCVVAVSSCPTAAGIRLVRLAVGLPKKA